MKVVFLDFDGPIIPLQSHHPIHRELQEKAWPPCVAALNRITDKTGAKIVVSSSWRTPGAKYCKDLLKKWGVTGEVIGVTPEHPYAPGKTRGGEIQEWLDTALDNGACMQGFVILDDDEDMAHLAPHLILTPFNVGLTEVDADNAISILKETRDAK